MKQKFYLFLVLLLALSITTKAFASLTFSTDAITGTTASTIDVGAGNALNIQTVGDGAVNMGGNLVVAGTLEATGNLLSSSLPKDALTTQGGLDSFSSSSAGESTVFGVNKLWTHDGGFIFMGPNVLQTRITGSGSGNIQSLYSIAQIDSTASGALNAYGAIFKSDNLSTAGSTGGAIGINSNAFNRGSSTILQATGLSISSGVWGGGGTATNAFGVYSGTSAFTSGTIVSGYNFYGSGSSKSGTGAITSFAGLALVNSTSATNNTGILLGTGTIPAGNFALYSSDTDSSYFAGKVGIGSTTPVSPLRVVGLPVYANNAAAIAGGLAAGDLYRTGADPDPVMVVH